jgi:hypothetical protein
MLRRIRGALVLGLLWAVVWLPVATIVGASFGWIVFPPRSTDWLLIGVFAGLGFASGMTFGGLLTGLERHRTIESIATGRLALWGLLAGAGIPVLLCIIVLAIVPADVHLARSAYGLFALLGVLGLATAQMSIALARRGTPSEIDSLDSAAKRFRELT